MEHAETLRPRKEIERAHSLVAMVMALALSTKESRENKVWRENMPVFTAMLTVLCWTLQCHDDQNFEEFLAKIEHSIVELDQSIGSLEQQRHDANAAKMS